MASQKDQDQYALPIVNGVRVPPVVTQERVDKMKDMILYPDDLWVVTYPKCGTTWTQQIVHLIHTRGEGSDKKLYLAIPWVEAFDNPSFYVNLEELNRPRSFKSHFHYDGMPCGPPHSTPCKYLYIARNPKDVAVSHFYHRMGLKHYPNLTWDEYYEDHMAGKTQFGDFFDHVLSWWEHRDDVNVLFLKFEDMKKDLRPSVISIARFMGLDLSQDIVDKIVAKSRFDAMKANPLTNYDWWNSKHLQEDPNAPPFLRKGVVGDWKTMFSQEQSEKMDRAYHQRTEGTGLEFDFE